MSRITLSQVEGVLRGEKFVVDAEAMAKVSRSYEFLGEFSKDKIIYGINTGFGPMAQWRVEDSDLKALQYNIIRSHSTGAGSRSTATRYALRWWRALAPSCRGVPAPSVPPRTHSSGR